MRITGTHFAYFQICHRKMWLFHHGIQMEQHSDLVGEGRLIHETSYQQRPNRYVELEMEGIKIDYYDPGKKCIHEVKKSSILEPAHEWQLKYYLHVLKKNGITDVYGILEYPKLRKKSEVHLSSLDEEAIDEMIRMMKRILENDASPEKERLKICRNCAYHDFCWSNEIETRE